MIKKIIFSFLTVFIVILSILFFDFISSNTIYNHKHCKKFLKDFYELKKNCSGKYRFSKSFPLVSVYTDELGLRVDKKKIIKDNKKENIFIFGDSFAYGVGLEYEKSFAGIITKKLSDYNFYNFSVSSYSPSVYLFRLKDVLKKDIKPKKVLFFLDLTDISDESRRWEFDDHNDTVKLKDEYLSIVNTSKDDKQNFKILRNISSFLNYSLRNLRAERKMKNNNEYKIKTTVQGNFTYTKQEDLNKDFWGDDHFNNGINNIKIKFKMINELAKKNNFEIYIVVYPWAETLEFGQNEFNWSKFANTLCYNKNCNVIDTFSYFKKYKENNKDWMLKLYFYNDPHFNENGSEFLANILIDRLKEK